MVFLPSFLNASFHIGFVLFRKIEKSRRSTKALIKAFSDIGRLFTPLFSGKKWKKYCRKAGYDEDSSHAFGMTGRTFYGSKGFIGGNRSET